MDISTARVIDNPENPKIEQHGEWKILDVSTEVGEKIYILWYEPTPNKKLPTPYVELQIVITADKLAELLEYIKKLNENG